MHEISFLSLEEVLELHAESLQLFGGRPGVRDLSLLESALAQPSMTFSGEYVHGDVLMMAAAYLFHVTGNHPFVDGNKRAGLAAAGTFLAINGFDIPEENTDALFEITMAAAESRTTKAEIAELFRRITIPIR